MLLDLSKLASRQNQTETMSPARLSSSKSSLKQTSNNLRYTKNRLAYTSSFFFESAEKQDINFLPEVYRLCRSMRFCLVTSSVYGNPALVLFTGSQKHKSIDSCPGLPEVLVKNQRCLFEGKLAVNQFTADLIQDSSRFEN